MAKRIISVLIVISLLFSFCACGKDEIKENDATEKNEIESNVNVDLKKMYDECAERMPEMIVLDAEMMLNYCGIDINDCAEYYVSICADSLRADEIWLIKAKDADALKNIAKLADARIKAKADESITYSPEQYAVVQKAEIIEKGVYFALVVSPDVLTLKDIVTNSL